MKAIYLDCSNWELTQLDLNEKLEKLYCWGNKLTELDLNDNLGILSCDGGVRLYNFSEKFGISIFMNYS